MSDITADHSYGLIIAELCAFCPTLYINCNGQGGFVPNWITGEKLWFESYWYRSAASQIYYAHSVLWHSKNLLLQTCPECQFYTLYDDNEIFKGLLN